MLGFVAAGLRGQTTLLPHSLAARQLEAIRAAYPDCHVLDDSCKSDLQWQDSPRNASLDVDEQATAAILFTSGSTGVPQPHPCTWGSLAALGRLDAQRLTGSRQMNLVVTVPSQHMYGLQTSVLLQLFGDCSVHDGKPFFPADVAAALRAVPAPRALITTPHHLRSCLDAGVALPRWTWFFPPPHRWLQSSPKKPNCCGRQPCWRFTARRKRAPLVHVGRQAANRGSCCPARGWTALRMAPCTTPATCRRHSP